MECLSFKSDKKKKDLFYQTALIGEESKKLKQNVTKKPQEVVV